MITHIVTRADGTTQISLIKKFHFHVQSNRQGSVFNNAVAGMIEFSYYFSDPSEIVAVGERLTYSQKSNLTPGFSPRSSTFDDTRVVGIYNVTDVDINKNVCYVIAYDDVIKLDIGYSIRLKELQAQGAFPMRIKDLIQDAVTYAGTSTGYGQEPILDIVALGEVDYFYSDSVTVRDIMNWAVMLRGGGGIRANRNGGISGFSYFTAGGNDNLTYPYNEYVICPTDQETYRNPYTQAVLINVPYKMDGLKVVNLDQPTVDCAQVYSATGELLQSYSPGGTENNVFTVYGNLLVDNLTEWTKQAYPTSVAYGVYNSVNLLQTKQLKKTVSVKLFPFYCYYLPYYPTYIVDSDGTLFEIQIMSADWTDDAVTIESFANMNIDGNGNDADENTTILSSSLSKLIAGLKQSIVETVYPVGSIYMSMDATDPGTIFGGTWNQLEDRFLLGAGTDYTAGDTGGEATHILTVSEMPTHTHVQNQHRHTSGFRNNISNGTGGARRGGPYAPSSDNDGDAYTEYATATNQNTGGDGAHNNMPPYLVVYMWERTA